MIRPDQLFNAPIPGQSLTEDPSSRKPWEMPPKFPEIGGALDHLYNTVTGKKFMRAFNKLIKEDKKFFIDRLASQMLQEGFLHGMWTVDMMLSLVEPLMTMLVWLASTMELPVSFSTDTGAEDRSGFEDIFGDLVGFNEGADVAEAEAEGSPVEPEILQEPVQQAAVALAAPQQSPLVGGM